MVGSKTNSYFYLYNIYNLIIINTFKLLSCFGPYYHTVAFLKDSDISPHIMSYNKLRTLYNNTHVLFGIWNEKTKVAKFSLRL